MHSRKLLPSALFLAVALLGPYAPSSAAKTCNADDEAGLLAFKAAITSDPSGLLATWKKGTDCCQWSGVDCRSGDRVTTLTIAGQPNNNLTASLSGPISPSLSKVKYLDGIFLQDLQNLAGPFPSFIFSLPRLSILYIGNNKLSGPLPSDIGKLKQLAVLSFQGNRFTGTIPASVGDLTNLLQLNLGGNLLTGPIPPGIGNLRNLSLISFERNELSGPTPDFFSGLSELRILQLSRNKLTGSIPASITALAPILRYLELGHNALSGSIPDFLGEFQALDTLDLSSNHFSGTVPKTFANLTTIFNLDLSYNHLVDPFPPMKVKGIESLDLSYNQFHLGSIPQWVTNSPIIYSLKLANCGIKIKLDSWNPSETYFYDYIDLSDNEITGSPAKLLNRTDYLVGFYASDNELKFDLGSVRIVSSLKYLDLSNNLVYGKVPAAVSGLAEVNVSRNHLCGQLPKAKFPASAFAGNDCLCGSPLPQCKA